ncbi:MAG: hypothetical protein ACQEWI_08610 [Bacillota bacterium]
MMGLLGGKREWPGGGYGFLSYREIWEACKEKGIFEKYDEGFAVMMDMMTVVEDGRLIGRDRKTGESWSGTIY